MGQTQKQRIKIGCQPPQIEYFLRIIIHNVQQSPLSPSNYASFGVTYFLAVL